MSTNKIIAIVVSIAVTMWFITLVVIANKQTEFENSQKGVQEEQSKKIEFTAEPDPVPTQPPVETQPTILVNKQTKEEERYQNLLNKKEIIELTNAQISDLEPQTLAPIFNYGSQHTDIQRENVEKVIKNQYIEWCVYVYEVSKISSNPPSYRVIVSGDTRQPSCIITLYPRDQFGIEEIETSQTGSRICIRGKIIGIGPLRSILIDPASSWCNAFN